MKLIRSLGSQSKTILMILGILAVRSSLAEPYRVPSSSMEPTIVPGDFLIVSKAEYELKLPFTDFVLAETGAPRRGDVVVFRYPKDPSINFVKRLVGLPGDQLEIQDGLITLNGHETIAMSPAQALPKILPRILTEKLDDSGHLIQKLEYHPGEKQFVTVPAGMYFFMGDNRDNSHDSRFWGFAPKSALLGKAKFVWLSLDWAHGLGQGQWTFPWVRASRSGLRL